MRIVDILDCKFPQGRRKGMDRRVFSYTYHLPERRLGVERRQRHQDHLGTRAKQLTARWKVAAA